MNRSFIPQLVSARHVMLFIAWSVMAGFDSKSTAAEPTAISRDGASKIIIETHTDAPKPPDIYSARANATATVYPDRIEQVVQLTFHVVQGDASRLSLGLVGNAQVIDAQGEHIKSWSVRQEGSNRFLDIHPHDEVRDIDAIITMRSGDLQLPTQISLTHITPGDSVGFDSIVTLQPAAGVDLTVAEVEGFARIGSGRQTNMFQTTTGGTIRLDVERDGAAPGPVELTDTTLEGSLDENGQSVSFRMRGIAHVTQPGAEIPILSGNAAVNQVPTAEPFRLRLSYDGEAPCYKLVFPDTGTFPLSLDFVATLSGSRANWQCVDFAVAAGAIVPVRLKGLGERLEFERDPSTVMLIRDQDAWVGFLPATGRAHLQWRTARRIGEGKLFFATTARVDATIGAGLLRHEHLIEFQVLQGELSTIELALHGPGEILDVQGKSIASWKVTGEGDTRRLDVALSQPITDASQIAVRCQTPVGAFPIRVEGLRLEPIGAIRHSGLLRLTNSGAVRLDPIELRGLTQLAPDHFPGGATEARQQFVYRFPAADHEFSIVADRIQPEVNVAQVVLYELTETDRAIRADVELDIREAPIRQWDATIPSDYSVVSVTGASVTDYITGSEIVDGRRDLRIVFGQDVVSRQLVSLHLEKNISANGDDWTLPHVAFPEAKAIRGEIGVVGAPGFRISVKEASRLAEKPLSYFPKPTPNLQQAFRIHDPDWSATMFVERLAQNVQSDVFHLYSLSEQTVYGSALINFFVSGAPASQWRLLVPEELANVVVDGQDVRDWQREGDELTITLHQPIMGAYTLLITFEQKPDVTQRSFRGGRIEPLDVNGERGYIQVVSPTLVEMKTLAATDDLLKLDPLELPAEFRLLSTAPSLGTWQYTSRPFDLNLQVDWFEPGAMVQQVVEFAEANSRVSKDGEIVTDVLYYVKTRGQSSLKLTLPAAPVRLWEASVNGHPVTARQADDATSIPLPGESDTNVPVEVLLRLGKPTVDKSRPKLNLPIVHAPVLKAEWHIAGDERHVLAPLGGTVTPPDPVLRPTGFHWVAQRGLGSLLAICLLAAAGAWAVRNVTPWRPIGLLAVLMSAVIACVTALEAYSQMAAPAPLNVGLPILPAGETVELKLQNIPRWLANYSSLGIVFALVGVAGVIWSYLSRAEGSVSGRESQREETAEGVSESPRDGDRKQVINDTRNWGRYRMPIRTIASFSIGLGILLQRDAAAYFFGALALAIVLLVFLAPAWETACWLGSQLHRAAARRKERRQAARSNDDTADPHHGGGAIATSVLVAALALSSIAKRAVADPPPRFEVADSIVQQWQITQSDARLHATGTLTLTGEAGDRFLLLKAPAVLTRFDGSGLRLAKFNLGEHGLAYVVSIPYADRAEANSELDDESIFEFVEAADVDGRPRQFTATFDFQLEALDPQDGVPVLTGIAAVQEIDMRYDEEGWEITSADAVRIESIAGDAGTTRAKILLGPDEASLSLAPKSRDVTTEETQVFVEAADLYVPGPGVVDGRHRLHFRTPQGQVDRLTMQVPSGFTVSDVDGPIGSWQFDAESGQLQLELEPAQSKSFDILVETQRGLSPLPVEIPLAPLTVAEVSGQVGLLAVAFGAEAQPEKTDLSGMSTVNLGDFDAGLLPSDDVTLHRVYRYGAEGGELTMRIVPVHPEVRVISNQVVSLGDERVVLGIQFTAEISRAGLFQLSFPLPSGFEVETLTGEALHHWSELSEEDDRRIILHLDGKTIGTHEFSLVLAGPAPTTVETWDLPHFQLSEVARQTGELVIRPTTGIRLRTATRQNVSEIDPRSVGGNGEGALAFRLLQKDWELSLAIDKLDPWITGQLLHEVTLREGQTRSALMAVFDVQNASVRALRVELPQISGEAMRTLRATGAAVSDFVRTAPDSNVWEVQFKRRVIGAVDFRIEYEHRGERDNMSETLNPVTFPQVRQMAYYFGVRAGGRMETEIDTMAQGWQLVDWNSVPPVLRALGTRSSPALVLRVVGSQHAMSIRAVRHSAANALKMRGTKGSLTTILSPNGDQLTAVVTTVKVIQRGSLSISLPDGSELFNIFVNGESVNSVRKGDDANVWQFHVLPGLDERTATVEFVYSAKGKNLGDITLISPELDVPLENIEWKVVAPKGFELVRNDGKLELVQREHRNNYDRASYLSLARGKRVQQAQQAAQLLEQANELLQAGEQSKARWALNSVANQYALDAASNEDARVQLENLQTQQAIVGLNTRRQRLYLNNDTMHASAGNDQLREAAAVNPILQDDQMEFRPQQLSQLLQGNSTEDNRILQMIAGRLVQHQRTAETAPQAILISLPEEGAIYHFRRSVQVAETEPLKLDLAFRARRKLGVWRMVTVLATLAIVTATVVVLPALGKQSRRAE